MKLKVDTSVLHEASNTLGETASEFEALLIKLDAIESETPYPMRLLQRFKFRKLRNLLSDTSLQVSKYALYLKHSENSYMLASAYASELSDKF